MRGENISLTIRLKRTRIQGCNNVLTISKVVVKPVAKAGVYFYRILEGSTTGDCGEWNPTKHKSDVEICRTFGRILIIFNCTFSRAYRKDLFTARRR